MNRRKRPKSLEEAMASMFATADRKREEKRKAHQQEAAAGPAVLGDLPTLADYPEPLRSRLAKQLGLS